ncbi:MAG: hypothetical protein IKH30_01650 [Clostridia bacterium]|nr:hypothetical protein [Clostridia bacterium]MBR4537256.1 hypothetical protein [Clostridia bacterium]MBR4540513.1 hypothetical protein [Clostridia bacterium]
MAEFRVSIADFSMTSSWTGSGEASTAAVDKSPDISAIPAGSTVSAAKLSCGLNIGLWGGTAKINGTDFEGNSVSNLDVKNCVSASASGFEITIPFRYKTKKEGYVDDGQPHSSTLNVSSAAVVIEYTPPYTACTPPTSVTAAKTDVAPGEKVRVSWSGAAGGTNNAIASYTVYRSADGTIWDELKKGVTAAYLDVTAPAENGAAYEYKVKTVGQVAGYDSERSTAYATVTCVFTAPGVSGVQIDGSAETVYKRAEEEAALQWTGTDGTNNPIEYYKIQKNGEDFAELTGTAFPIGASKTPGQHDVYTVIPVGEYSSGTGADSPALYTYSAPKAPDTVSLAKETAEPGETTRLSWSGAEDGAFCAITGYKVYSARNVSGAYELIGETENTWFDVAASEARGYTRYFKIKAAGTRMDSGFSPAAALRTEWPAPPRPEPDMPPQAEDRQITLEQALHTVDELTPNQIERARKIDWLNRLDGRIYREIYCTHERRNAEEVPDVCPRYTQATHPDTVLLAPEPYGEIYRFYLEMQIHLANQDYDRYNNSAALYAEKYGEFARMWHRTHKPLGSRGAIWRF